MTWTRVTTPGIESAPQSRKIPGSGAIGMALVVGALLTPLDDGWVGAIMGVDGGVQVPVSDWTQHPYATGIDHFAPGLYGRLSSEWPLGGVVGLVAGAAYGSFDVGEWVSHARGLGAELDARAQAAWVDLGFTAGRRTSSIVALKLVFGATWFIPSGRETFEGTSYDYSFLSSRLGFLGGLEIDYAVGRSIALALGATIRYVPGGVRYAGGQTRDAIVIPLTLGFRFET